MPINGSKHFMVSAFIDHRLDGVIRVISIINRDSLQPLYCVYCSTVYDCRTVQADVQIHTDHFSFPYGASDVICKGKHVQDATHVLITTDGKDSVDSKMEYLPIRNKVARETFKFNFTICISNLFGDYNNVLQFAQTIEMYKLLGVQHVVIYKTKCGPDLKKLLKHYETEGILEIVSWPIDKFLNPSSGWNINTHKGDIQYYGQLVTLNECIYRHMYQSRYVLLNDIDEIIMPYKHSNLPLLMEDLQSAHPNVGVFLIENHIFPKTQFEESGKFKRAEWNNIPGKPSDDPLHPDYIPSKLPHRPDTFRNMDRYQRSLRRASQVSEMSIGVQPTEEVQDMDIDVTQVKSFNDMCVGTDLTMSDIEDMQKQNTSYKEQMQCLYHYLQL
ncbi:glycosyltransferase family 92 protein [Pimephales promelas]|nr:glycosyltransferase family 92 protein [Pimephales promelas]